MTAPNLDFLGSHGDSRTLMVLRLLEAAADNGGKINLNMFGEDGIPPYSDFKDFFTMQDLRALARDNYRFRDDPEYRPPRRKRRKSYLTTVPGHKWEFQDLEIVVVEKDEGE